MTDIFIGIILAIAGVGLFVFVKGWRRRVDLDQRFCRRCNYRVDPIEHVEGLVQVCSECGQPLSRLTTRMGRREPNRWMAALGAAALLFSSGVIGTWVYGTFEGLNWSRMLPTWYLLRTDISESTSYGASHINILRERYVNQELSDAAAHEFAEVLATRASDMFDDPNIAVVQFSGITLDALRNYTPPPETVASLLDSLIAFEVAEGQFLVELRSNDEAILWRPPLIYLPNHFSFDMTRSYRSLIGRMRITELRRSDGQPIDIIEDRAPTHVIIDRAAWDGSPLTLECTINWVFDSDPLPDGYSARFPTLNPHVSDREVWWTTTHTIQVDRAQAAPYIPTHNELRSW